VFSLIAILIKDNYTHQRLYSFILDYIHTFTLTQSTAQTIEYCTFNVWIIWICTTCHY